MSAINFREYKTFDTPSSVTPLIQGVEPTSENLRKHRKTFEVRDKSTGHILTPKEWSDVVGDNIVQFGIIPEPKAKFRLSGLEFRMKDSDGNVIKDWS